MIDRDAFGYVVAVENGTVRINLLDAHRGQMAGHSQGISPVVDPGTPFGVNGGPVLFVLRVRAVSFVEPREAHRAGVGTTNLSAEPLRILEGTPMGTLSRVGSRKVFTPDSGVSPSLGAAAYPLLPAELAALLEDGEAGTRVLLGTEARTGLSVSVALTPFLGRHVAVLGGTGQGKTCFTAAVLQQLAAQPKSRIVVFDVNGEYGDALRQHAGIRYKETVLGGPTPTLKIPYYAFGRHGLSRLLLPSEKTQRPALAFALENLARVEWDGVQRGARLAGQTTSVFFDDGRPGDASRTAQALEQLRAGTSPLATRWPAMLALGALVADSHAVKQGSRGFERDAWTYGNVSPLVTRIRRFVDDPRFTEVVDVDGGPSHVAMRWEDEGRAVVEDIFGGPALGSWRVHVVNLRSVVHDLMPMVLGSLLELLALALFERGQENSFPTLLVLEEAHHYLRQVADGEDPEKTALAYERLAKEGRKFGLSLWVSTQRPSEVSPTVLAQCGTWAVFRLSGERDLKAVAAAGEWVDRDELRRVAALPRQHAVVFGAGIPLPVRLCSRVADPRPRSHDPDFGRWT